MGDAYQTCHWTLRRNRGESHHVGSDGPFMWFCLGWMTVCIPDDHGPHFKAPLLAQYSCIRLPKFRSFRDCLDARLNGGTRMTSAYCFKVLEWTSIVVQGQPYFTQPSDPVLWHFPGSATRTYELDFFDPWVTIFHLIIYN